jgi:tetratricopeptide (TPR) repeat protein
VFQILVELYTDTGTREQIIDLARRRVVAAKAGFGPNDARTAPAEVMLAAVQINFGEYDEARALLDNAKGLLDRAGDDTSLERARLLRWQGLLALATNQDLPWDEHPLRRGIQLMNARYGDTDDHLAALSDLPSVACRYGRANEAMAGANELYDRTIRRYGRDNLFAAEAIAQRARILQLTDHAQEAIPLWEASLAGMHKYVGEDSPNIVAVLSHLAESYAAVGRIADSEQTMAAMHTAAEKHPGNAHVAALISRAQATIEKIQRGRLPHCGK